MSRDILKSAVYLTSNSGDTHLPSSPKVPTLQWVHRRATNTISHLSCNTPFSVSRNHICFHQSSWGSWSMGCTLHTPHASCRTVLQKKKR